MKSFNRPVLMLRALDANCNRVREGLRVAEDVARFILNDSRLISQLKKLRHEVTAVEKTLFISNRIRIEARNVKEDLGRKNHLETEKTRANLKDLLTANLKRSQEGLRSLEEFSKALGHPSALKFKKIRYACYQIEESLPS